MSGIRVRPGLKGRAGYAAGVCATNSQVKLLTNFSGNQDDNPLSRRIALAQIDVGADIIFTMLNAGRDGVSQACRDRSKRQIGNVIDWVNVDPAIFIGIRPAKSSLTADTKRMLPFRKQATSDAAATPGSGWPDALAVVRAHP